MDNAPPPAPHSIVGWPHANKSPLVTPRTGQKRSRDTSGEDDSERKKGTQTPLLMVRDGTDESSTLLSTPSNFTSRIYQRFVKRPRRDNTSIVAVDACKVASSAIEVACRQSQSDLLRICPDEIVGEVLSFLGTPGDRFSLQLTCTQFRRLSNSNELLRNMELWGDKETGRMAILSPSDTWETALGALKPFYYRENVQAMYMAGIILCYCSGDVERGVQILREASNRGLHRSSYAMGIILRDTDPEESSRRLILAAENAYFPAIQEILSGDEMRERYGETDADELRKWMDPICLTRVLINHHMDVSRMREVRTSHCWNPLCGRWAYKLDASRFRAPGANDVSLRVSPGVIAVAPADSLATAVHMSAASRQALAVIAHRLAASPQHNHQLAAANEPSPAEKQLRYPRWQYDFARAVYCGRVRLVSRMKMCSSCHKAKYCSKLCQVYDWRSDRHKNECQHL